MTGIATLSELGWPEPLPVPESMQAMLFRRFGPPNVLEQATLDTPIPALARSSCRSPPSAKRR